jgi:hypothetical protein
VKYKAFQYLSPGTEMKEIKGNDITSQPELMNRLCEYLGIPTTKAKPASPRKRKVRR